MPVQFLFAGKDHRENAGQDLIKRIIKISMPQFLAEPFIPTTLWRGVHDACAGVGCPGMNTPT
jgi:hypothetical protein